MVRNTDPSVFPVASDLPFFSRVPVDRLELVLPEPPSLNVMLDLAKRRTRRTRDGHWTKRPLPIVYDNAKHDYEVACLAAIRSTRVWLPPEPWPRWRIDAIAFRLHQLRDPLELIAGLKWVVDWLVKIDALANDSTKELLSVPIPTQHVDRKHRGITLTISEVA